MTSPSRRRPRIGLSTRGAPDGHAIADLVRAGCEAVELVGLDTAGWDAVAPLVAGAPVPVGLHCPIPYDGVLRRFDISSTDPAERAVAIGLVERTLAEAVRSAAAYVVVHFPSPWPAPDPGSWTAADRRRRDEVLRLGEGLALVRDRADVPVYVENLSHHPDFGSADDYVALFTAYPNLRMCLDAGHAYVSAHVGDLAEFVAATAPFVASAHVYTTRRTGPHGGRHEPPTADRTPDGGWLDVSAVLAQLAELSTVENLVLEYSPAVAAGGDPHRSLESLRDLADGLTWT